MRCVFCVEREQILSEGRVQGFWISSGVTLMVLVLAAIFFPEAVAWLVSIRW